MRKRIHKERCLHCRYKLAMKGTYDTDTPSILRMSASRSGPRRQNLRYKPHHILLHYDELHCFSIGRYSPSCQYSSNMSIYFLSLFSVVLHLVQLIAAACLSDGTYQLTLCSGLNYEGCQIVPTGASCCHPMEPQFETKLLSAKGWWDTCTLYAESNCRGHAHCLDSTGISDMSHLPRFRSYFCYNGGPPSCQKPGGDAPQR